LFFALFKKKQTLHTIRHKFKIFTEKDDRNIDRAPKQRHCCSKNNYINNKTHTFNQYQKIGLRFCCSIFIRPQSSEIDDWWENKTQRRKRRA
jgi:hypothetical protein